MVTIEVTCTSTLLEPILLTSVDKHALQSSIPVDRIWWTINGNTHWHSSTFTLQTVLSSNRASLLTQPLLRRFRTNCVNHSSCDKFAIVHEGIVIEYGGTGIVVLTYTIIIMSKPSYNTGTCCTVKHINSRLLTLRFTLKGSRICKSSSFSFRRSLPVCVDSSAFKQSLVSLTTIILQ